MKNFLLSFILLLSFGAFAQNNPDLREPWEPTGPICIYDYNFKLDCPRLNDLAGTYELEICFVGFMSNYEDAVARVQDYYCTYGKFPSYTRIIKFTPWLPEVMSTLPEKK